MKTNPTIYYVERWYYKHVQHSSLHNQVSCSPQHKASLFLSVCLASLSQYILLHPFCIQPQHWISNLVCCPGKLPGIYSPQPPLPLLPDGVFAYSRSSKIHIHLIYFVCFSDEVIVPTPCQKGYGVGIPFTQHLGYP